MCEKLQRERWEEKEKSSEFPLPRNFPFHFSHFSTFASSSSSIYFFSSFVHQIFCVEYVCLKPTNGEAKNRYKILLLEKAKIKLYIYCAGSFCIDISNEFWVSGRCFESFTIFSISVEYFVSMLFRILFFWGTLYVYDSNFCFFFV